MDNSSQQKLTELNRLALAGFGHLSAAEEELLRSAATGSQIEKTCDPKQADTWRHDRRLRVELLAWLCTDEQAARCVHWRGIQAYGADIDTDDKDLVSIADNKDLENISKKIRSLNPLNLSFVKTLFPIALRSCRLRVPTILSKAEVSDLDLSGSIVESIIADHLIVKHSVLLRNGFKANGEVRLVAAQLGGDLDCTLGTLRNDNGPALDADAIEVKGSIHMYGFRAKGEVRLRRARVTGFLNCEAAWFRSEKGPALNADGIQLGGSAFLRSRFATDGAVDTTHRFIAHGEVRLPIAQIAGDLDCSGASFCSGADPTNTDRIAINADGIKIDGTVSLRFDFIADGEVRFVDARIRGVLDCSDAEFLNPGGKALIGDRIDVGGTVMLIQSDAPFRATGRPGARFHATGEVRWQRARIGGALRCEGADFNAATLDLTLASAAILQYSPKTLWPQRDKLTLDGFEYRALSSLERQIDADERITWLGLQPPAPFRRRPYLQLAKTLRDSGDNDGSLLVLTNMEDLRRRINLLHLPTGIVRAWRWTCSFVLKTTIGYGYYPRRAIWALLILVVIGWIVYGTIERSNMAPTDTTKYMEYKCNHRATLDGYPEFSPLTYSLESSLPLVKLGQADKWEPDPETAPRVVIWLPRIQTLLGWLLATLFVAGFTGLIRKD